MKAVWKTKAAMKAAMNTAVARARETAPFAIRTERGSDIAARERLLDASFGTDRHTRTCQRLRDGRVPARGLAFAALQHGRLIGTVRLWHVSAGGVPALVLGPLAVDAASRSLGVGAALMEHALTAAKAQGYGAVILRGDPAYYARFGFSTAKTGALALPGPFEPERLLAVELRPGALDNAWGMIVATGDKAPRSRIVGRARKLAISAA